jgi:hypothetical protein
MESNNNFGGKKRYPEKALLENENEIKNNEVTEKKGKKGKRSKFRKNKKDERKDNNGNKEANENQEKVPYLSNPDFKSILKSEKFEEYYKVKKYI